MSEFSYAPISCTVCGEDDPKPHSQVQITRRSKMPVLEPVLRTPVQFSECGVCHSVYMNPAPTDEGLNLYYGKDFFSGDKSSPANFVETLRFSDRLFFKCSRTLPKTSGKVLDIGAGNKKYLLWLKEQGYEVMGFDYAEYPGVQGSEDIEVIVGDIQDRNLKESSFDVITMFWVLENLKNPLELLQHCFRLLKPNGALVIGTINGKCIDATLWKDYWHHLLVPEHISLFDSKSIVQLVERAGFSFKQRRYDLLSFDFLLSLWDYFYYKWGIDLPIRNSLIQASLVPIGWLKSKLGLSGLMTIQAVKA